MNDYTQALDAHATARAHALALLPLLARLEEQGVYLSFFGKPLSLSVDALLALHAQHDLKKTLDFVQKLDTQNTRLDVGLALQDGYSLTGKGNVPACDVVLFGFGRIGRILTRLLMARPASCSGLQLKAIVVRPAGEDDLQKRASLLTKDSVHGKFSGSVVVDKERQAFIINGRLVKVIYADDPSAVDYTAYGISNALVIDNTGKFKDEAGLGKHLQSQGVAKVLLTAPAKGNIKNVVYGVNHDTIGDDTIVSAASCTTNAITPTLKILHETFGIDNGHMETIHAYTNDQNLVDNYHKAERRGRAAALNMVMTSTGAASAVAKAIPELAGKLSGSSIRVPTPNVSLAILNLNFTKPVGDKDSLNALLQQAASSAKWQAQIAYSDSTEAVSTDFVSEERVAVFDAPSTIAQGNRATLYLWYDNEMGYSTQVIRVAETMAGIDFQCQP